MSDVHSECTGYPLVVGKATGLRSFNVDGLGRLRGVSYPQLWTPGENVARCGGNTGRCASESCGCGFWAYHDGSEYPEGHVTGVIRGYGKTTVGPRGFRCEKAEIVALSMPVPRQSDKSRWERFSKAIAESNAALGIVATFIALVAVAVILSLWLTWALAAVPVFLLGIAVTIAADMHTPSAPTVAGGLSGDLAAKVRRNYLDMEVYGSLAAMTKAHPLDPTLEPTPETDPDFWTVETVAPSASFVPLSITAGMFAAAYPKNTAPSVKVSSDQCPCGCGRDDSLDCTEDDEDDVV